MCAQTFRVLKPGGVYILLSVALPCSRLPWLFEEPGLDWTVAVMSYARRSAVKTDRYGVHNKGNAFVTDARGVLVPAAEEMRVGGDGNWEAQLRVLGEDDRDDRFTFLYLCRKRVPGADEQAHGTAHTQLLPTWRPREAGTRGLEESLCTTLPVP